MAKSARVIVREAISSNWFQNRDLKILMSLYRLKLLDVDLVTMWHFPSMSGKAKAYQRIRKLTKAKLVEEYWKSGKKYLKLSTAGAHLVAGQLGCEVDDLKWRTGKEHTLTTIEHTIGINRIGAVLNRVRSIEQTRLEQFITEPQVDKWKPDALGRMIHEKDMPFALEYDRDTQSPKVFGERKVRYATNALKQGMTGDMFPIFPVLLVITEGDDKRVHRLKKQVEENLKVKMTWLLTTMEEFEREPLGKIWLTPNKDSRYSLLQAGR